MDDESRLDHDAARARMAEAIEGTLSADDERELAIHLVGCADCKSLYSSLQQAEVALRGLAFSHPPTKVLESAIARATTVLRGEADPGSGGPAPVPQPAHAGFGDEVDIASPESVLQPAPIPIPAPVPYEPEPVPFLETAEETRIEDDEPHTVRAILSRPDDDEDEPAAFTSPVAAPTVEPPVREAPSGTEEIRTDALPEPAPPVPLPPPPRPRARLFADVDREMTDDDLVLPPLPPRPGEPDAAPAPIEAEPVGAEPADVEAARHAPEAPPAAPAPPPAQPRPRRARAGAGRWLAAVTAAVVLALIAGFLITRSQSGGGAPTADEVRGRVQSRFAQLRSLKASFTIRRLDLYAVSRRGATMQYSFSDGTTTGRVVFDRAGGFREESTTEVAGNEIATTRIAQTVGELRTLQGSGANARLVAVRNPPFGPPDGQFYPSLGSLDRAVGAVAEMIVRARDLEVVGTRRTTDREVIDVTLRVTPTELTRADKIDVALDARTYVPVHVRREISRVNGRVLAPESVLGGAALQTAFGNRDRILTEDTVLSDVVVDDVILPGDFVLDVPQGTSTQNTNGSFQRVTRADLGSRVRSFAPLFPASLPEGFTEQGLEVYAGTPGTWGPNRSYPAPDGVVHAKYSDGKTTIVVTQRHLPRGPINISASPISGTTLPIQVTPQDRDTKTFSYGWSPEVAPHAYGFIGNVFVMVTGYAPADQLVDILASMAPAPGGSSPAASPLSSPAASPVSSPGSSPVATVPLPTATP